jgi:predicted nucleic acid-binding protein
MATYYLDSSAVVKRYVAEVGSDWVRAICHDVQSTLFLSELDLVEVSSAFARRCRGGDITDEDRRSYLDLFIHDCAHHYHLIPIERPTIERAVDLAQQHYLRGYDAVQLASALTVNDHLVAAGLPSLTFVSADDDLVAAARSQQLLTENPNLC